jgi:hypothetical protein
LSAKSVRRGFVAEDYKWFSEQAVKELRIAQQEVQWLLDRGYKAKAVISFVGQQHQLSSRQRIALQRASSSRKQCLRRKTSLLPLEAAKEGCLYIDGFNLVIILEVALSGSVLILGNDGVLRDLAGLRGSYKIIAQTEKALQLIQQSLENLAVPGVKFYLDAPVSNSGKLKKLILEHSAAWEMPVEVELVPNADAFLLKSERIVTGDSLLLDKCLSWFNISRKIVEEQIREAWIIRFENNW